MRPEQPVTVPELVEQFDEAWRSADGEPDLRTYLPDSPVQRRVALIELVKVDLRNRWSQGKAPKRLAQYCEEIPELGSWPLPPDLIYEEFHVRRNNGSAPDESEYTEDYPDQAELLSEMLGTGVYESTLMTHSGSAGTLVELDAGRRINDFDLMTELGRGAFARVFLARQRSMQRLVAVKISEDHGTEPQTLAQLDHDYIVRVFDQRLLEGGKLRLLYMQYLPGGTLLSVVKLVRQTPLANRSGRLLLQAIDQVLADKGEIRPTDSAVRAELAALTWPETVAWLGRRLADALDYAGSRGVLHRDIKPANVLLTADGVPKLADFNISFSTEIPGDSPVAYFGGSLSYMSPEQLAAIHPDKPGTAADLDTRSDLYSLGVVLWELLTGSKPFADSAGKDAGDRTTLDAMLEQRSHGVDPHPRAELPADCPAALSRVLTKMLEPDPADRWSSGAELAQQLDVCLDPRARDLVDPPPDSWRLRLRRWPHPIMALAIAVPNLLAILYSYQHNRTLIIDNLDPAAQHRFDLLTKWSYGIAFPAGIAMTTYLITYLFVVSNGLRKGRSYDAAALSRARTDTLQLGQRIAVMIFALWVLAGILVPLTLQLSGSDMAFDAVVHFSASQIVCGAIAIVYPYFLVNFYAVRCLYPAFLPHGEVTADDASRLRRLDRRSTLYLAAAAAVPLIGVAGATFIPPADLPKVIVAVRVLCVGSALAFVGAYWLFRLLEDDLRALERVVRAR
ncbi:serine/threonine-protein kinase [Antrihabitans cavernicola]|uniref:Serine/threonine protein kinase n=1 Tax=Antrihabitans cavernicola TaxID=2495913 RepID=A0A5A7S9W0_9NOCA|nr:serine/threonine-protein kinase [Spelaeibacter cavernicola]KAA0022069.1 serine/threonine protein kinase [Spelaeibacter cavernicola]